ncbi:uncharacterized protein DUF4395 [Alkalispirillum mobile]|uniref:Uncharacterized protein DUF4395 n=1 Tax=Alkalispirillum mobile TaxID=85925 RepID=A0A498C6U6_9GAMM|nr:DUF4395 domain-containing protein [Alkalispirillum mobile]RLK48810.1 uncharacterized protein DUF4395 [Alkalispirillum mobile]
MGKLFQFGERMEEYAVPVLNEREARAGAGILFVAALIAFLQAFQLGSFTPMRMVVLAFFLDFAIRVLVNPRFAPSLVLGRLLVGNQEPEYVGAPQKRFAWALGLGIATVVMFLVFGLNSAGPVVLAACLVCIVLMFFETAFGICIGCKMYNMFFKERAQLCPGGVCSIQRKEPITRVRPAHVLVLAGFIAVLAVSAPIVAGLEQPERLAAVAALSE